MEHTEKSNLLGEAPIAKLLLRFSVPCILSLLISSLYNMVDQIFIGNSDIGYLGNAATGIVFPIMIISLAFAWCFGDGSAAYLSICQGKQDTQTAHKGVGNAIGASFLVGLFLVVIIYLFQEELLRLFGASDATIGMATAYLRIVLFAFPIYMPFNTMNAVIRADGSPHFAMLSIIVGAVINIILDPIFIFVLHWGIQGAAYATVIGQVASFVMSLLYVSRSKSFHLKKQSFLPDWRVFHRIVMMGISTFITEMSIVVVSLVCNMMLFRYGLISVYGPDIPISVISIETKVYSIVINIVVGIILGGQPILGYNYGAQKFDRVRQTFRLVLISTCAVGLLSTLLFECYPQVVISLFGDGSPLYHNFAMQTFRIFLSLVSFTCIIKMTSIFFQAIGHPVKATLVSLTRDIVCFIPLVIILSKFWGIYGILWAAPIADLIAFILTVSMLRCFFRSMPRTMGAASTGLPIANPLSKKR